MREDKHISAKVLGQIALMQSVVIQLPDRKHMLKFVCRGLKDIDTVYKVDYVLFDESSLTYTESIKPGSQEKIFYIQNNSHKYAALVFQITDEKGFNQYTPYIKNFCNMLAVIFERHQQRKLNESLMADLELRVAQRTKKLESEIKNRQHAEEELKAVNQQLEANNQQLQATEEQLRSTNQLLEAKNEQWRNVLENTRNVHYSHTTDHVITFVSPQIKEILGYTPEEAKINWTKLTSDNPINEIGYKNTLKAIESGERQDPYELELIRKDGKKVFVEVNESPLVTNGITTAIVGSLADITERRKAEQALRENKEKYKLLVENQSDLIVKVDLEGRFQYVSPSYCKLFGKTEAELLGKKFMPLVHVEDKEKTDKEMEKLYRPPYTCYVEQRAKTRNGWKWLSWTDTAILNENNEVVEIIGLGQDITERKQAEIKLKESENKYRTIFYSTGTVTMLVRNNTHIEMANNEAERVTGFTAEELTGSKWTDHVAPHSLERMMHYHKTRRTNPEKVPSQYEVDLIHKSGEIRRSLLTIGMIPNSELSIVTLIDVTELYKTNQKLKEAQEIARLGNLEWNLLTNETYWSSLLLQIHGLDQKDSIPSFDEFLEHVHEDDRKLIKESVAKALETGKYLCEYRIKRFDTGEIRYLYTVGRIEYDGKHQPILLKATEQDITERKEAEQKIIQQNEKYEALNEELRQANNDLYRAIQREEESNDRFNKAMEATSDGIFDWNLITNQIYFSPRWKSILGYKEDELPDDFSVWEQLTNPADVNRAWEMFNALIEGKKDKFDIEFKMKHKKGHWVDVNSRANVFRNNKGKAFRMVGTHTDITARKQSAHELLLAKEKAEESDRLKSAFLTNMSHEIRTPMNGILGFTDLLKEPQLSGEKKNRYIQVIERSGKRMLDTINDIIDISKIEAGQVKVEKSAVSVNKLLDDQYVFFQREAKAKGLELYYNPKLADEKSFIVTDPYKLEGVLVNLIKNAIKYTNQGEIEMGCQIKEKEGTEFLEFFVKDTGIGIPSNRTKSVFNRFEQADIEDKKALEGSGLGLAISKSYVEMLGGNIGVESAEGEGSTFFFSIPYIIDNQVEKSTKKAMENGKHTSFNNASVIIAEDDNDSRFFLKTILKNDFKSIIYTSTGSETIEAIEKNPDTSIILMDIKMPEMNGHDATREIRKFNQDVIIIAQTAYGLSGDEEKAIEAGCDDYIAKPITKGALFEKIEVCLDKKRKQI